MAYDVRQNATASVRLHAMGTSALTSPTLEILDPDGGDVTGAGTLTAPSLATTVASSPSNAYTWPLASVAGLAVGDYLAVSTAGIVSVVEVMTISGTTVVVHPPPVSTPAIGDAVVGRTYLVSVPATATADLGAGYRIIVTGTAGGELRAAYNVVLRPFLAAIGSHHIRGLLADHWPSATLYEQTMRRLAEAVQQEIRDDLLAAGRYASVYPDPSPFVALGLTIARRILATQHGLYPVDVDDRQEYIAQLDAERAHRIGRIVSSAQARDEDQDGAIDEPTVQMLAVRTRR